MDTNQVSLQHPSAPASEQTEILPPVIEAFETPQAANLAYAVVLPLGYDQDDVGVIMTAETRDKFTSPGPITHPEIVDRNEVEDPEAVEQSKESVSTKRVLQGAGILGSAGALSGVLLGVGANVIAPGIGLIMLGPMAGIGAGIGAMLGSLYGIPIVEEKHKEELHQFDADVQAGKIVIHLLPRTRRDAEIIRSEWRRIKNGEE